MHSMCGAVASCCRGGCSYNVGIAFCARCLRCCGGPRLFNGLAELLKAGMEHTHAPPPSACIKVPSRLQETGQY